MYIYSEVVTPNGASARVHRINRVEISEDVRVFINSYNGPDSDLTIWQDTFTMPVSLLGELPYPQSVYAWLTSAGGPYPYGAVLSSPSSIELTRVRLTSEVTRLRDVHISQGVVTPLGRTDSDEVSIRNIMGAYQSASLALITKTPYAVGWRMSDNNTVQMDAMGMITIGNAVLAHVQACYERSWALKNEIVAAETIEELEAIVTTQGWPA